MSCWLDPTLSFQQSCRKLEICRRFSFYIGISLFARRARLDFFVVQNNNLLRVRWVFTHYRYLNFEVICIQNFRMIIPIRCFTCGKVIGNKWVSCFVHVLQVQVLLLTFWIFFFSQETYLGLLQAEYTEGYTILLITLLFLCVV